MTSQLKNTVDYFNVSLIALVLLLMTLSMLSCEKFEIDSLKLTNITSQSVYYMVMTVEISTLIDLNPIFPIDSEDRRNKIITPGKTASVSENEIMGYNPGDDLQLYFYEIIRDTAYFSGGLRFTNKKLQELKFQVVLNDENLTQRKVQ